MVIKIHMAKQNVQHIETAIVALNNNQAVDVTQWSDHKVEQALRQMVPLNAQVVDHTSSHYHTFCSTLFQRWTATRRKTKSHGLSKLSEGTLSLEDVALKSVGSQHNTALELLLPYIDSTFNQSLLMREAVQRLNFDAVRLLMPHTNMSDVAAFGIEMACRHANRYVLDTFLPHSDPTALNYYLVRNAVHRYIDSKNKEESLALLQDVVRRADDIHVQSGRVPVSDDIDVIENLKPSVRSVLFNATQPLRFNRDLEQQAFSAHRSQLKTQRKM